MVVVAARDSGASDFEGEDNEPLPLFEELRGEDAAVRPIEEIQYKINRLGRDKRNNPLNQHPIEDISQNPIQN
jgi:hypothetical protein